MFCLGGDSRGRCSSLTVIHNAPTRKIIEGGYNFMKSEEELRQIMASVYTKDNFIIQLYKDIEELKKEIQELKKGLETVKEIQKQYKPRLRL